MYEKNRQNKENRRIANTELKRKSRIKMGEDKKQAIKDYDKIRKKIAYYKKKSEIIR